MVASAQSSGYPIGASDFPLAIPLSNDFTIYGYVLVCNTSYHLICGGCTRVLLLQWYVYKLQVFSFVSAFLLPLFLLLLLLLLDCLILLLLFCCCFCSFHYVVGFVTHNGVLLCFLLFLLISFLLVFFCAVLCYCHYSLYAARLRICDVFTVVLVTCFLVM